jgi:8-oxo-dGTP diphosphatase/2-hydroxy-dATP diphosphatase
MHVFRTSTYAGTPVETDEMRPHWYGIHELPFRQMWPSDLYWWPLMLQGKKFTGAFDLDEEDGVLSHDVRVADTLPA